MATQPKLKVAVGSSWTDSRGRVWTVYERLPFGRARVRSGMRFGEMRDRDILPLLAAASETPTPVKRPLTRTEHLEEARVRQAGRGFVSPFLSVTDEQLARADADIASWKERSRARQSNVASGFKLTPYGLERIAK